MKDILIGLLVLAIVLLLLGAVNSDVRVDLDYLFGDWRGVSLLWLAVIVVGVVVVAALVTASLVRMRVIGDCRKLEAELQRTYTRLREAEAGLAAAAPAVTAGGAVAGAVEASGEVVAVDSEVAEAGGETTAGGSDAADPAVR